MIHGWTGDETVMWIFARALPQNSWLFAPRGPVAAPGGGYGWISIRQASLPRYEHYTGVAVQLMEQVDHWLKTNHVPASNLDIVGFSQGAAVAYTILADYPERVNRLAALAGYLPEGASARFNPLVLEGKKVFIAHGSQDKTIPVDTARRAAEELQSAHARVTYCEDDIGHKLGAACLKNLETFFAD